MMSKENLLSTKQFATLCQTTKHTLIHYDEIGILKPNYIGEKLDTTLQVVPMSMSGSTICSPVTKKIIEH